MIIPPHTYVVGRVIRSNRPSRDVNPNVSAFNRTSEELADYVLEQAGVAVLPGTAFGDGGEGYLRLCFANSMENIQKALERISTALVKLGTV